MFRPVSAFFTVALCAASLTSFGTLSSRPAFAADEWDAKTALVQSLRQSGARFQKAGDFPGAIAAYRQAVHADPADPDTYADLADVFFQKGQTADALRWYREATGTLPGQKWAASRMEDGDLCLRCAVCLAQMNRFDEALTMYQKGRETLPSGTRKLFPGKWSSKKLVTDANEQKAFLMASQLALGAWYATPELAQNDPTAGEKAASAFRVASALSPSDPTLNLLVQHGLLVRRVAQAEDEKAPGATLVRRVQ